jgi:hypothetical protein
MDITEYNERQRSLTEAIAAYVLRLFWPFRRPKLTQADWNSILRGLYPEVEYQRGQSARLGREFYDSQREKYAKATARWDLDLASYRFEWFQEAMEPAKKGMLKSNSTEADIANVIQRVSKEVENGGRRTILRPIQDEEKRDPVVKGWARVATGRETCGFCMMLISRGPVYFSAEDAGLDLDDTSALELIDEGDAEALNEAMKRWHPGCDCKVVPVFDRKNWAGRDAYLRAERLWIEATKGYKGRDALNALRRALERGDLNPADFAVAA